MSLFNQNKIENVAANNMFLSSDMNISRTDKPKYPDMVAAHDKQEANRWGPGEIPMLEDPRQFKELPDHMRNIVLQNLQYQSLLDSVQGRAPALTFGQLVSLPELENWVMSWTASEVIHNISYMHIIRTVINDPSLVFDAVMENEAIMKRAEEITRYYDELHELASLYKVAGYGKYMVPDSNDANEYRMVLVTPDKLMKAIYMCLHATNALEAVRFYVSFACTWAFNENGLLMGIGNVIKLIARDEALHMAITQNMINNICNGKEGPEWKRIAEECHLEAHDMFITVAEQEMEWADHLFKDGSVLGLNAVILKKYVKYLTNIRMNAIGLGTPYPEEHENPISWINKYIGGISVQTAPQEDEVTDYTRKIDGNVGTLDIDDLL